MSFAHGQALRKHLERLLEQRRELTADGVLDEARDWDQCFEEFTGRPYYHNTRTDAKRRAPPYLDPQAQAFLFVINEDAFSERLKALAQAKPQGIVVCQQSFKPDVTLSGFKEESLDDAALSVPMAMVTYEAGVELKDLCQTAETYLTFEVQTKGGVFAWGNGTCGQMGVGEVENDNPLIGADNPLTGERNYYTCSPTYVTSLHELEVRDLACGSAHCVAVTSKGQALAWGKADGVGVPLAKPSQDFPVFVEQLENLVHVKEAFAGYTGSFVTGDMPCPSVFTEQDG